MNLKGEWEKTSMFNCFVLLKGTMKPFLNEIEENQILLCSITGVTVTGAWIEPF